MAYQDTILNMTQRQKELGLNPQVALCFTIKFLTCKYNPQEKSDTTQPTGAGRKEAKPCLWYRKKENTNMCIRQWPKPFLGMPGVAGLPGISHIHGTVTIQFPGTYWAEYIPWVTSLEGSCAATDGYCQNTVCASAGRPKSHSRSKSVASAGLGYAVQLPVLPKVGCQLAAVTAP